MQAMASRRAYNPAFGSFVKERRGGMRQIEYAERLGISMSYLSRIETGLVPPDRTIQEMARRAGDDPSEWLAAAGYEDQPGAVAEQPAGYGPAFPAQRLPPGAPEPLQGVVQHHGDVIIEGGAEGGKSNPLEGSMSFGVRVETDSLYSKYERGDILVVKPTNRARPGQTVVVASDDGYLLAVFCGRQKDSLLLRPVNAPDSAKGEPAPGRIVAVVVESRRPHL